MIPHGEAKCVQKERAAVGLWGSLEGNVLSAKPGGQSSSPKTHMVEGELVPQAVL